MIIHGRSLARTWIAGSECWPWNETSSRGVYPLRTSATPERRPVEYPAIARIWLRKSCGDQVLDIGSAGSRVRLDRDRSGTALTRCHEISAGLGARLRILHESSSNPQMCR